METCKSPWTVMRVAHDAATHVLPAYASPYSRHDFTLPQLFVCLAVRELVRLSYRKVEALLNDTDWCQRLGMTKVPDASTLCRASNEMLTPDDAEGLLGLLVKAMKDAGLTGDTLAIDSTMFDTHRRSRHYERRCKAQASDGENTVNQRRSVSVKTMPKLAIGIDTPSGGKRQPKSLTSLNSGHWGDAGLWFGPPVC